MRRAAASGAVVAILISMSGQTAFAAPPDKACSVLKEREIKDVVGAPTKSKEIEVPVKQGPSTGETMRTCSWAVPVGVLTLTFVKTGAGLEARTAFRAIMQQSDEVLKMRGWKLEEKTFGAEFCWTATPPATNSDAGYSTGCSGEINGLGVSVGASTAKKLSMEKVKALLVTAMGHLK
jgi:hypothetical protein